MVLDSYLEAAGEVEFERREVWEECSVSECRESRFAERTLVHSQNAEIRRDRALRGNDGFIGDPTAGEFEEADLRPPLRIAEA